MPSSLHTREYQIFRAMLTQARRASGVTQAQLAEQLGKPQSYVSKYETGKRRLDAPEFFRVADVLGIDIAAFVEEFRAALSAPKRPRGRRKA